MMLWALAWSQFANPLKVGGQGRNRTTDSWKRCHENSQPTQRALSALGEPLM